MWDIEFKIVIFNPEVTRTAENRMQKPAELITNTTNTYIDNAYEIFSNL